MTLRWLEAENGNASEDSIKIKNIREKENPLISHSVIRLFSSHTYEESVTVSQKLQLSGERETST